MNGLDLVKYIKGLPEWMQYNCKSLLVGEEVTCEKLLDLCKQEAKGVLPKLDLKIEDSVAFSSDTEEIKLLSIGNIQGINKLAPRKPLEFKDSGLSIIYGENGSGKSGYVKILKHVTNARNKEELLPDVFSSGDTLQTAEIKYKKNNIEEIHHLDISSSCTDLSSADIFDSSYTGTFTNKGNTACYEPPELTFWDSLISVCDELKSKIESEIAELSSELPTPPNGLLLTEEVKWFQGINKSTKQSEIDTKCSFFEKDNEKLNELNRRLNIKSPQENQQQILRFKSNLKSLIKEIIRLNKKYSLEAVTDIVDAAKQVNLKKKLSKEASEKLFSSSELEGIGSDVWRRLWEVAREYSNSTAYNEEKFPNTSSSALCVLCQQPLSTEAKQRFLSFEQYIQDAVEKDVVLATKKLNALINDLPKIIDTEDLKTKIDACDISDMGLIEDVTSYYSVLQKRKKDISQVLSDNVEFGELPEVTFLTKCFCILKEYRNQIRNLKEDIKESNREELMRNKCQLEARKWLSENKNSLYLEVDRLNKISDLNDAIKILNTRKISKIKSSISQEILTDAFTSRFNEELCLLKANTIHVELVKASVCKGSVNHVIKLKSSSEHKVNVLKVLSEGEIRIISIAGFLADVRGRKAVSPFVFDDPISSLDQKFEEAVVKRLSELSKERQVIVFTHRLSLLGLIQREASNESVPYSTTCIRSEYWGNGESGGIPVCGMKPQSILNYLRDTRLSKAKKIMEAEGMEAYCIEAKSICSDYRILLERMIEEVMISGVVMRFSREIQTKGKIGRLSKITKEHCALFDGLMTKYSKYEHSQPTEAPVVLPLPSELLDDICILQEWCNNF